MQLILGSSSPFRKQLLQQLDLDFITDSPDIDESPLQNESVEEMVLRLSIEKAREIAKRHSDSLVIGSDQSALLNGKVLHKPGNHETAVSQLKDASGQTVVFQTGLCLFNTNSNTYQSKLVPYSVTFRTLTDAMIENYLLKEKPYNCAGSFKSEGLGIALFEKMQGTDPSALIGLPLIELVNMLEQESFSVL
ncbi:MAG: Maf family nucleotide pyrophosphatase [Gammaproteobacteria bacterium]|nr:Maf family nucleotide pyrophosphatase [Gammaproteobacteria bacterium]